MTFVNGVASEYDEASYDKEMMGDYISEAEFRYVIGSLNVTLAQFWPCDVAIFIGYLLAPFSFGLSLFLPYLCISDAKNSLEDQVMRMNTLKLNQKDL